MTDLLSWIDHFDVSGGYLVSAGSTGEYVRADEVREALSNPTDEQVEAIALAVWDKALGVGVEEVRAVLAAAAGGDDG